MMTPAVEAVEDAPSADALRALADEDEKDAEAAVGRAYRARERYARLPRDHPDRAEAMAEARDADRDAETHRAAAQELRRRAREAAEAERLDRAQELMEAHTVRIGETYREVGEILAPVMCAREQEAAQIELAFGKLREIKDALTERAILPDLLGVQASALPDNPLRGLAAALESSEADNLPHRVGVLLRRAGHRRGDRSPAHPPCGARANSVRRGRAGCGDPRVLREVGIRSSARTRGGEAVGSCRSVPRKEGASVPRIAPPWRLNLHTGTHRFISMSERLDHATVEAIELATRSARELAETVGVHEMTLSGWRTGRVSITPTNARRLADAVRQRALAALRSAERLEAVAETEGGDG